jgi:FkbM family methyltransferase
MIEKVPGLRKVWPYVDPVYRRWFPRLHAWHSTKVFPRFEQEILLLPYLVNPDEIAIDVGANIGVYTSYLIRITSKVETFEPNPELALFLKKRFGHKAHIHDMALSDTAGDAVLEINFGAERNGLVPEEAKLMIGPAQIGDAPTQKHVATRVEKLDSFKFDNVGFIKIDVEGHEINVLEGGRETLLRCRPALLIEAELRHASDAVHKLGEFLGNFGYQGFFLLHGRLLAIDQFSPAMQEPSNMHTSGWAERRRYINNFIFLSEGRQQKLFSGLNFDR